MVFNTVGSKTITASYSGDMNYVSSSNATSHVVGQGPSTTSITSDLPDPSAVGQSVSVHVTVTGAGATPLGTVAITSGPLNCSITLVGGTGSCSITFTSTGSFVINAAYSGDVNYTPSATNANHTVN